MTLGASKTKDGRVVRRNYGNGHGYTIDGQKADGVTTVLGNSVPKPALVGWAAGSVGGLVFDEPDTIESMKKVGRDGFIKAMKEVPSNDRDQAGNKGTAVHKLAEQLARGEEVDVPEYLQGHVDSYLRFRDAFLPEDEMVEAVVVNVKYRYGGTLDSWSHLSRLKEAKDENGSPLCSCKHRCLSLVDIKTNRSGPFGDTCLQLAAYSGASHFIDAAGELREMPKFDHYFVLWLRSDDYDLVPFDVTDRDRKTFLYCQQVHKFTDWKTGRVSKVKGAAVTPPPLG